MWGVCAMTSIPDPSWVSLQMISPGPGPPSLPLSGSSCPSTKLRSAAGKGRAADPRPRQRPEPTGGDPLPQAYAHPAVGLCGPLPGHSDLCICGYVCLSRHLPLHGSGTWFGGLGPGSPLYRLSPSLPVTSSVSPVPPFAPECPSTPDPPLPTLYPLSAPLLWGGASGGKPLSPLPLELPPPVCLLQ